MNGVPEPAKWRSSAGNMTSQPSVNHPNHFVPFSCVRASMVYLFMVSACWALSGTFFSRRSPPKKINNGNGKQEEHVNGSWWDFFSLFFSSFLPWWCSLGMTPRASPFGHGFGSQLLWAKRQKSRHGRMIYGTFTLPKIYFWFMLIFFCTVLGYLIAKLFTSIWSTNSKDNRESKRRGRLFWSFAPRARLHKEIKFKWREIIFLSHLIEYRGTGGADDAGVDLFIFPTRGGPAHPEHANYSLRSHLERLRSLLLLSIHRASAAQ